MYNAFKNMQYCVYKITLRAFKLANSEIRSSRFNSLPYVVFNCYQC